MNSLVFVLFGLLIAVAVFILCREFVCWYFRLVKIEEKLSFIVALLGGEKKAKEILNIK